MLVVVFVAGCGDDATQPPSPSGDGTIRGEIGDADFEFVIERAGSPADPLEGPFALRGTNLHYDDELGALVVDLTVINRGIYPHHEPVGLTFINLIPDDVTVLNPDNGVHGEGAAFVFAFANDDGVWTPGESSLPRTVQFGVAKGLSIGFVAFLNIGETIDGGDIRGVVWHDANENGVRDENEPGLPGVGVQMWSFSDGDGEDSTATRAAWVTETGPDGVYEFSQLRAGGYAVSIAMATLWYRPTTPTEIRVLLVEADGDVADFNGADFGVIPQDMPPPPFELGQRMNVAGKFMPPDVLVPWSLITAWCPDDTIPGPLDGGDGGDPGDPSCTGATVRGPVTGFGREGHAFRVMNTWFLAESSVIPFRIEMGMRLDVHLHRGLNTEAWIADRIAKWEEDPEMLIGRVEAIEPGPDGVMRVRILDTWIPLVGPVSQDGR
jgi:hypothetical protein